MEYANNLQKIFFKINLQIPNHPPTFVADKTENVMEILKLILYILTGATALVGLIALYAYGRAALRGELPQDAMDNDNWYNK